MICLYFFVACLAFVESSPPIRRRSAFSVQSQQCWSDPAWVTDVVCQYKPVRYKLGSFAYGFKYVKPAYPWLYLESFERTSVNVWKRGSIYFKENLCKTGEFRKTLSFQFLPLFEEIMAKYFVTCPHSGLREFNQTIDNVNNPFFNFLTTGYYRVIFNFAHGEKNATFFKVDFILYYKGKSLSIN